MIDTLSVDEYEPTFKFRTSDGRSASSRRLDLVPGTALQDAGIDRRVRTERSWWGSDLPVRYDIAIRGDSVSLDDVNWVYPTLPRTGGGKLDLLIRNDPKNLQIIDFKLVEHGRAETQVSTHRRHVVRCRSSGAARAQRQRAR